MTPCPALALPARAAVALALLACAASPADDQTTDTAGAPLTPIAPAVTWERSPLAGSAATWWVPPAPRGVLWLFHGSGGDALFPDNLECTSLLNTFTEAGYGFVALESTDRQRRTWQLDDHDPADNPDLARVDAARAELVAAGHLPPETPTIGLGFSNGATFLGPFTSLVTERGWPFSGLLVHNGVPTGPRGRSLDAPTFWVSAANDQTVDPAWVQDRFDAQREGDQPAALAQSPEAPLRPDWFVRIPNLDAAESQQAFDAYVSLGIIDADGRRLPPVAEVEAALDAARDQLGVDRAPQITTAARVRFALHAFDGRHAVEELAFIEQRR